MYDLPSTSELLMWLWANIAKTCVFYTAVWATLAFIILLLVTDKQQRKSLMKASATMIPIIMVVMFFSVGSIRLPAFDSVLNRILGFNQAPIIVADATIIPKTPYSTSPPPKQATAPPATDRTKTVTPAVAEKPAAKEAAASKQREKLNPAKKEFVDTRSPAEKRENVFKLPPGMENGGESGTHEVIMGDTIYSLGRQYSVSPKAIIEINGLKNPDELKIGDKLKIPQ